MSDLGQTNQPERKSTTATTGVGSTKPTTTLGQEKRETWRDKPQGEPAWTSGGSATATSEHHERRTTSSAYQEVRHGYAGNGRPTIMTTLRELAGDVGLLAKQEAELARTEISEKIDQAKKAMSELAIGGALAYAGLLFLMLSAMFGLNLALEAFWLSALVVGGIVFVIGLALLASARSNLKATNLTPERTARSLREDAEMARNETTRRSHE